ncbi:MAG: hypothetical protein ACFCU4_04990 [Puniceicoccaceae bacterium]
MKSIPRSLPLRRLFARSGGPIQKLFAWLGVLSGLSILLVSIHLYLEFLRFTTAGNEWISSRYLIIQKTVTVRDSFSQGRATFSEEEIDHLGSFPSVTGIARFRSNSFPAGIQIGGGIFPEFFSYVFLESVPDAFVDAPAKGWSFDPKKNEIPVLIPSEYLNLYNFGFAPSQGLPQIPPSMVHRVPFSVLFFLDDQTLRFSGRIVGFSDRINSILVPDTFLESINLRASPGSPPSPPARLLLEVADSPDPDLLTLLESPGYSLNREALSGGQIRRLAHRVAFALLSLGSGVVVLGVLVVLLALERQLEQSRSRIHTVFLLGHHPRHLIAFFQRRLALFVLGAVLFAYIIHRYTGRQLEEVFNRTGEFSGFLATRPEIDLLAAGSAITLLLWTAIRIRLSIWSFFRNTLPS